MLNLLWAAMILIGILWGTFHGTLGAITDQILSSAKDAVQLCITMLGILSFWTGILEIGEQAGLLTRFSRVLAPILRWIFPQVPDDHPAQKAIATNMVANLLGLGWAATPAGLEAMKELASLSPHPVASNAMCTFLILNMSSLQLLPIHMIAYRSQYGSTAPALIVMPALMATIGTSLAGLLAAKAGERWWPRP